MTSSILTNLEQDLNMQTLEPPQDNQTIDRVATFQHKQGLKTISVGSAPRTVCNTVTPL